MRRFWCASLAVVALVSVGCKGGLPSKDKEIEMGQDVAREYEQKLPDGPIITRGPEVERVQRVAAKLLPLARKDWDVPYSVKVVQSDQINAFAIPGGPIYFYTGLIKLAESDDELASVLGHEITHITKRHSVKQLKKNRDLMVGLATLDVLLKGGNSIKSAAEVYANFKSMAFSRSDENQADEFGFKYLVSMGYKPEAMAGFFTKMGAKTGGGGGKLAEFFSTHPMTSERVKAATERAEKFRKGTYKAP
ncbi:M48 family metallopeptidase [Armatimonas rosea]|uniref:Putative Zn-dependent protease n=1 Tax=Armatimonas rosea TaxID=685828 RepID=A0A7W9SU26_ARMRO|nr:M48 family metallopeptidase [Armatimonas rosea]MBB6052048.1 putative Zn-dependent protease [Armatimonas rosea]